MAVTHKKTVNFSGVAGGGQANYNWQDPNVNWITWPPTQVGATDEWEFVVASNPGAQRQATIEVRHWDYANDNSLTDSFTITQAAAPSVPTYTGLSGAPDPANEGQQVTFTVQGTDLSGTPTVPYTLSGNGINASDINGGVLSGNITMANTTGNVWQGTLTVTLTNDQTQEGTENLICSLGTTDSNGVATGGLTTNVQVNDTSTQPSTVSIELQWYESSTTTGNWQVSGSSITSGTATNVTATADAVNFDAAPGEVMQFTITGTTNGTDFTSVGGADIITIFAQTAGGSLVSENLINQDSISFIYQYTVPSANETVGVTFAAETITDSITNGIWASSGVDNPQTNFTTGGTGQNNYTLNNSANNPVSFIVKIQLQPDGNLATTGTGPEVYFASDAAGQNVIVPWFVSVNSIDNAHSDSISNARITFDEGVVVGPSNPSGGPGPGQNPTTPNSSNAQYGGSPGAEPMAGPSPGSNNQCYIIIKHPADASNFVSINYTGSSQVTTTTQAPSPTYTFTWTTKSSPSPTVNLPASSGNPAGTEFGLLNTFNFTWDGPALTGGTAAASDFNWPFWTGLQPGATCSVFNTNGTTHSGGNGYVIFDWTDDGSAPANQTNATGVTFDGGGSGPYTLDSSSVTSSGYVTLDAASCHVTGTVMNLANGSTKLVEELQVGDVLKSYTIQGLGEDENQQPWQTYSSQINQWSATETTAEVKSIVSSSWDKYVNINNGLTKVTNEHPVLIKGSGNDISFKEVKDVVIGDSLYVNGAWVEVTSLEDVNENITAYKIDVESADVYLADGILWHNAVNVGKN